MEWKLRDRITLSQLYLSFGEDDYFHDCVVSFGRSQFYDATLHVF